MEEYIKLDPIEGRTILRCACCGGQGELWQLTDERQTVHKLVCCERMDLFGDDSALMESCPLYITGTAFCRATKREAIEYWNKVQLRLQQLQLESLQQAVKLGG